MFRRHGETFAFPTNAVLLATSAACRNQAFQIGARAMGLQFHLETTPKSADAIVCDCADELVPHRRYIQSESALRAVPAGHYARINTLMTNVLDYLVRNGG